MAEAWFNLIIGGLLVWIIARLLIYERGLWGIFEKWRHFLGITEDAYGNPLPPQKELALVFSCLTCLSLWVAIPVTLYLHMPLHFILVYTGMSVFLNRVSN